MSATDSDAKRDILARRKLAAKFSERPSVLPAGNDKVGQGNSVVNLSVHGFHRAKKGHTGKYVDLGHTSNFLDPSVHVARGIRDALDPNSAQNSHGEVTVQGEGAGGTIVRGRVVRRSRNGGVRVSVYGATIWLKGKWVNDLGDERLWINNFAFNTSRLLMWARKRHRDRVAALMKKRTVSHA